MPVHKEAWHAIPNKLLFAPAHFRRRGAENRLVHLFGQYAFADLHLNFRNLTRIGTTRDKFGSLAAKFHSSCPRARCATRYCPATFGSGRHYHF